MRRESEVRRESRSVKISVFDEVLFAVSRL